MIMTRQSYKEEVESLRNDLLKMAHLVEKSIIRSVESLAKKDIDLAKRIIAEDDIIDDMEHDIEKRCLRLLALQQPMASDLRAIGTALKIITDLERIADHASDIAKVTIRLDGQPLIKPLIDIPRMANIAESMIHDVLTAFVDGDIELAEEVSRRDDDVDNLYSQIFRELLLIMMEDPRTITQATYLLFVAQYLERVADHVTNLSEWVIYMVTGERKELNE
jgi:phosphate transport system protein